MAVIPVAKALYLCEETDVEGGLTNLYGLFSTVYPDAYPYTLGSFTCFAQLIGGLGQVSFYIDVRRARDGLLIHNTQVRSLRFSDRATLIQLAVHIERCVFEEPGIYLAELYCENEWVADVAFRLREVGS
jgi:hypothetical protein